jgi:hypothetical protein
MKIMTDAPIGIVRGLRGRVDARRMVSVLTFTLMALIGRYRPKRNNSATR